MEQQGAGEPVLLLRQRLLPFAEAVWATMPAPTLAFFNRQQLEASSDLPNDSKFYI